MIFQETYTLSNGINIPRLGFGTWCIRDEKVEKAVQAALQIGYRHIDTAQVYGNERGVGEAIRQSKIKREDIFLTSKIAAEAKDYDTAMKTIEGTLAKTQMEYIDMMIIHSPQPWDEVNVSENRYEEGNREAWRALEDAYQSGKIRAIGVSNFNRYDIENILSVAKIKPMVNQILCHIANTPLELIDFCDENGIIVEAYSPIAHGEAFKIKEIEDMAKKYEVTVPQLCIRYDWQLGTVVLPKAENPEHIKENSQIDFVISDEDMNTLKQVELIKNYGEYSHYPVYANPGKK